MIGIYKLISPNGKVYIGQSIDIKVRMNRYKNLHCKAQAAIYNAIVKYGWENIKVEILWSSEDTTNAKDILNELEQDFINLYNCIAPNGYNLKSGGNSYTMSDESKLKMSIAGKGKTLSEEHKRKISIANSGINVSDETRRKKSEAHKGLKASEESKLKMSQNSTVKRAVIQMDKSGNYINEWESATKAGKELNISIQNISSAAKGNLKSAGGYLWKIK